MILNLKSIWFDLDEAEVRMCVKMLQENISTSQQKNGNFFRENSAFRLFTDSSKYQIVI